MTHKLEISLGQNHPLHKIRRFIPRLSEITKDSPLSGLCGEAEGTSLGKDAQEPSAAGAGHERPPGPGGTRFFLGAGWVELS